MPTSNDPDHFFQTSDSLAEAERKLQKSKNNNGNPIKLKSKILAAIVDPRCPKNALFVATSVGHIIRVVIDTTDEPKGLFKGPTTPATCLAASPNGTRILAGCWDKTIWSWSVADRQQLLRYRGHKDFVKCLVTLRLGQTDVIVSGGADAALIVWNMRSGEKIHVLQGHTRGVLDLAVDPIAYDPDNTDTDSNSEATIFSAGSDREIRRWRISLEKAEQLDPDQPILVHETSVYALRFDADGDLWTASADGNAKCLSRSHEFQADTTLNHGDYVRTVALEETGGYVITAGRSESLKVWDRATGDLLHTFEGHFDEVTGLVMFGQRCVSVGIDCTVRTWSLKPEDLRDARREEDEGKRALEAGEDDGDAYGADQIAGSSLTEEEERELAELMDDD